MLVLLMPSLFFPTVVTLMPFKNDHFVIGVPAFWTDIFRSDLPTQESECLYKWLELKYTQAGTGSTESYFVKMSLDVN